jgi:hypothetical protein
MQGGRTARSSPGAGAPRLLILIALSAVICGTVFACLHRPWTPLPWLIAIALWACYFWSGQVEPSPPSPGPGSFPYAVLLLVLTVAGVLRLYRLDAFPLGPYMDEILTLHHSLGLLHQPFDLFGHVPLAREGWVETAHLYLYFDLLVLKLFGIGFWGMKLFSVIPGIVASGAVFLISRLLFERRVALWTALLFSFAHWPVRLSRYGWDVSFMVMMFSLAIWLLLLALRRGRPLHAYLSGLAAGLCLYSYLASRVCLLSLLGFLLLESAVRSGRGVFRHGVAFATGAAAAAFPLLFYYLSRPGAFWVRTAELNVFNDGHPFVVIARNLWRHGLMFHVLGGTYSRDNFPGLPMMDVVTGLFLVAGVATLGRMVGPSAARLIGSAFVVNFAGGVLSVSQEGAPYVYRTAAVMIPAFLIAGAGLGWMTKEAESRLGGRRLLRTVRVLTWAVVLFAMIVNLYLYFGLEPGNFGAMRVMAYEPGLIGREISRDNALVVLAGRDVLGSAETGPKPGEHHASSNPPIRLPRPIGMMAVIHLSGRYDETRSVTENLLHPRGIVFADPASPDADGMPAHGPAKIIFRSQDQGLRERVRNDYPGAMVREIKDVRGEPLFAVVTVPPG